MKHRIISLIVGIACCISGMAQGHEYHVSAQTGSDTGAGTLSQPFKTISAAAQVAMPGDVITVHEGTYREQVVPPRGGTSDKQRITYQAAEGERVVITGSEPVKGWTKVDDSTWKLTLPNSFFGASNPFDEQLYGSWYHGNGKPNHTGSVYLNGQRIRETFTLQEVLHPTHDRPIWYAEADGNGGEVLMNFEWIRPSHGKQQTSMQAAVENGDQAICISVENRWPFGYLKDGSVLHFEEVDFGNASDTLYFQAATLAKGGMVEMHLDHPEGEWMGTAMVTNTGDWERFAIFPLQLKRPLSGKHTVCLTLKAPAKKMDGNTTLWARFPQGTDPNQEAVEISVRPQVFYPAQAGIHYLTVRGFILENAATNWAPPSAEQPGLIGTRWSKGWVIENNVIRHSRCSGIALGRSTFGHSHHYQPLPPRIYAEPNGGQTVQQLTDYFEHASWDKEETGFHVVRNNVIYDCGQAGIVGCSGGAFSTIEGNEIHDVCLDETFTGEEIAGIKLHFANDAIIRNNHIYRCFRGLWLDWGGQGIQVTGNLFHDNLASEDVFIEVCHGPILLANNLLLSPHALNLAQGIAIVHNLVGGKISGGKDRCAGGRMTFYYPPHSTVSLGKAPNPGGDLQWMNNLFVATADIHHMDEPELPIDEKANVTLTAAASGEIRLEEQADGWYLQLPARSTWAESETCQTVTTATLHESLTTKQPFTQPDDAPLKINKDYQGAKRKSHPCPGPFELKGNEPCRWKVWNKKAIDN